MNWIQSLIMGFVSGLCELLPLSADAHQGLLLRFFGLDAQGALFELMCHGAILAVLLAAGRLELIRLHRTARQLRTAGSRRASHANLNQSGTLRLLRLALLPAIAGRLLSRPLGFIADRLWLLPITLLLGGLIGWLPTHFRTGNRDGRHLTPIDGLLMGLAAALGAVPGISPVGTVLAVGSICGIHRSYALRTAWLLQAVGLAAAVVMDLLSLSSAGFQAAQLAGALLGAAAAAAGAYLAIRAALGLARSGGRGFSGFSFYNWGLALLCLVLFLLV